MYYAALVPCICAALISKKIAALLGVKEDAFHVFNDLPLSVPSGLKVVFLAACCAAVSILFCLTLQLAHKLLHRCFSNSYLRIVSGGCLIILLTLLCGTQDYLGTGIHIIEQALDGHAVPYAFLLKILFTSITIAAGYRGGEIVPSLFIGATFWLLPGRPDRPSSFPVRSRRYGFNLLRSYQLSVCFPDHLL